jgi:Protein of unknown function (DUF2752)
MDRLRSASLVLLASMLASICDRRTQGRRSHMSLLRIQGRMNGQVHGRHYPPIWASASFGAYLLWNIQWMAAGRIPPSIMRWFLGIPCPTTGCTRSLLALFHGDIRGSLLWNPFTVPIVLMLAISAGTLLVAASRKRELALQRWMAPAWWVVLSVAWFSKFLLGRMYW